MKYLLTVIATLGFSYSAMAHNHDHDTEHSKMPNEKVVEVEIGKKGFTPNPVNAKRGENLVLKVKRTTKKTCMTALKHPKSGKLVKLPLNKEVRFELGKFDSAKKVDLLCGMDMKAGVVQIN